MEKSNYKLPDTWLYKLLPINFCALYPMREQTLLNFYIIIIIYG